MKLEDVLLLVRDARAAIETGRVEDAAWLLEAIEEDLAAVEDAGVTTERPFKNSRFKKIEDQGGTLGNGSEFGPPPRPGEKKATSRSPAGDPQPEGHLPDDPPTTGAARAAIF